MSAVRVVFCCMLVLGVGGLTAAPSSAQSSPTIAPGELVITEIMTDPTLVSDTAGEWFEIRSRRAGVTDLDGLVVRDDDTDMFVVAGPLLVSFGDRVVFARNGDPLANGGITPDYAYGGAMILGNGVDELVLEADGVVIDRVAWDDGATFPDTAGASMTLDPSRDDPDLNDDGANWCAAVTAYNAADLGTPGAANDACGLEPIATPELGTWALSGAGVLGVGALAGSVRWGVEGMKRRGRAA